jgi:hypothetical protein
VAETFIIEGASGERTRNEPKALSLDPAGSIPSRPSSPFGAPHKGKGRGWGDAYSLRRTDEPIGPTLDVRYPTEQEAFQGGDLRNRDRLLNDGWRESVGNVGSPRKANAGATWKASRGAGFPWGWRGRKMRGGVRPPRASNVSRPRAWAPVLRRLRRVPRRHPQRGSPAAHRTRRSTGR